MCALPSVSVVVPVYNQAAILPLTLPAITALDDALEIILVDDGSSDTSASLLAGAASGHARIVPHRENRGRAAARNAGLAATRGEVVLFLDADIIPKPGLPTAHARRYLDPSVIGVLSHDRPDDLDEREPFHRYLLETAGPGAIGPDEPLHFKYFIAGYASIRRRALEEVGAFDEQITYGEDLELAYRLWRRWPQGLRREPSAIVHQRCIGDLGERCRRLYAFGTNLPALLQKHPDLAARAGLRHLTSAPSSWLLRPALAHVARALLPAAPRPAQTHLIRLILGAAVASGYRSARART